MKTKYTDLPGFSRILVSWLCLEACPAALESAEILFLAVGKQIWACYSKSSSASKLVSSSRSARPLKATPGASEPLKLCHVKPGQCGV